MSLVDHPGKFLIISLRGPNEAWTARGVELDEAVPEHYSEVYLDGDFFDNHLHEDNGEEC